MDKIPPKRIERLDEPGLRPVTMLQLNGATGNKKSLIVDGRKLGSVMVFGKIISFDEYSDACINGAAGYHTARITDGTGSVILKTWSDKGHIPVGWTKGAYVRGIGTATRCFGTTVISGTYRNVVTHNELTFHLLSAIEVHFRILKSNLVVISGPAVVTDHTAVAVVVVVVVVADDTPIS